MTATLQYIHKHNAATAFVAIAAIALFAELMFMRSFVPTLPAAESNESKALMDQVCSVDAIAKTANLIASTKTSTSNLSERLSNDVQLWQQSLHSMHAFGMPPADGEATPLFEHAGDSMFADAEFAEGQLSVQSIMKGRKSLANINGKIYKVGDSIDLRGGSLTVLVSEVFADSVVITVAGDDGESTDRTLYLKRFEQLVSGNNM